MHFLKNIFLINEFYGSLTNKILRKIISKTHTKALQKRFATFIFFCFSLVVSLHEAGKQL